MRDADLCRVVMRVTMSWRALLGQCGWSPRSRVIALHLRKDQTSRPQGLPIRERHRPIEDAVIRRSGAMGDLEPRSEAVEARELRTAAAASLQSAARQRDPGEFDRLTRHALRLIELARAIQYGRRRPVPKEHSPSVSQDDLPTSAKKDLPMSRKLGAELIGRIRRLCSWRRDADELWRFWIVPIGIAPAMAFLYAWLGADDGVAECDEAARHPVLEPGELTRGSRGLTWTTNGDMLGLGRPPARRWTGPTMRLSGVILSCLVCLALEAAGRWSGRSHLGLRRSARSWPFRRRLLVRPAAATAARAAARLAVTAVLVAGPPSADMAHGAAIVPSRGRFRAAR